MALQQQQQQMGGLAESAYPPPMARNSLPGNANANSSSAGYTNGNGNGNGNSAPSSSSGAADEEVSENANSIRICIDMPGVHSKDLKVQLRNNGVLEVRAIRRRTGLDGTTVVRKHKIARRYAIDVQTVDVNRVVADLALGVLVITAPKVGSQQLPPSALPAAATTGIGAKTSTARATTTANPRGLLGSSTHSTSRNNKRTAQAAATQPSSSPVSTTFVRASKRVSTDHSPSEHEAVQGHPGNEPRGSQDSCPGAAAAAAAAAGQSDGSLGVVVAVRGHDGTTPATTFAPSPADNHDGILAAVAAEAAEAAVPSASEAHHDDNDDASGGQQGDDEDEDAGSAGPVLSRRVSVTP
jgi:HSP20 family molecular chaperone IbpA